MANTIEIEPIYSIALSPHDAEVVGQLTLLHEGETGPSRVATYVRDWAETTKGDRKARLELAGLEGQYALDLLSVAATNRLIDTSRVEVHVPRRMQRKARQVRESLLSPEEEAEDAQVELSALDQAIVRGVTGAVRFMQARHGARHARRILGRVTHLKAA